MKVSHELPLKLLGESAKLNDYDYFLPHLAEEYQEYADYFIQARKDGRYIIMDNSLHELGAAMGDDILHKWLYIIEPNEFIVPDVWEQPKATIENARVWSKKSVPKHTTKVAVAQGLSYQDIVTCMVSFKTMGYKKVALSYGSHLFVNHGLQHPNPSYSKMMGRLWVVDRLVHEGVLIPGKDRLHLLGCSLPQEFGFHKNSSYESLIESIDTSSPIMAALEGIKYDEYGLRDKPKTNMNNSFDSHLTPQQSIYVNYNVNMFRTINNL